MSFIRAVFVSIVILSVGLTAPVPSYGTDSVSKTMVLSLTRKPTTNGAVIGVLHINKSTYYTLENESTLIPPGSYRLQRHYSKKHERDVLLLQGVPNRSNIQIEIGNFKEDSKGCILVGLSHTDKSVVASQAALTRILRQFREPAVLIVA